MQPERRTKNPRHVRALTRRPGVNFAAGLTTSALGAPDFTRALEQHDRYCRTLRALGLEVVTLDADLDHPDGCFVEDTAIVMPSVTVITRPGAASRAGETAKIAHALSHLPQEQIRAPGMLDGGDVMEIDGCYYIGLSERTNEEGAAQLAAIAVRQGLRAEILRFAAPVLHLKTGISYAGRGTVIGTDVFVSHPAFDRYERVIVPEEESCAANTLRVNDALVMAEGFPQTKQRLEAGGFRPVTLETTEFRKMDGALTCLSLLCYA